MIASCTINHNQNKFEVCFELRGTHHEEPNPEDSINLSGLRNLEIAYQLILQPRESSFNRI